ncbi:MAG: hypothetical protein CVU99_01615 [Firmicutes bacterium HGW-Firmicutes-4]|jgi:hypothetical protein|nr:MAG: hypothetical protein CVU99_01615 [Firmicutes bacterium HGW-Firmicutes-4]
MDGYYKAVFPEGVVGELVKSKDGTGFRGIIKDSAGQFVGQPVFTPATGNIETMKTVIPVDPMTLVIAVALINIEKKLDDILETQKEILEFLKQQEKAKLRGNLNVLEDVLNNYKYNWDNEKYKTNKHITVQEITGTHGDGGVAPCKRVTRLHPKHPSSYPLKPSRASDQATMQAD